MNYLLKKKKKKIFYSETHVFELGTPLSCSLRPLCLQSTPLWSRVGSRPPTRAKRASFPRTTSLTCERHDDVITPSLYNTELYLKAAGVSGAALLPTTSIYCATVTLTELLWLRVDDLCAVCLCV